MMFTDEMLRLTKGAPVTFEVRGLEVVPGPVRFLTSDLTDVVVEVRGTSTIRGRVLYRGAPIQGAEVHLETNDQTTTSAADGTFSFDLVPAGPVSLRASIPRLHATSSSVELTLAPGESRDNVDIALDLSASIAGVVVDERGNPVEGAWVTFTCARARDFRTGPTDAEGRFRVVHLAGKGDYLASVKSKGGIAGSEYAPAPGGAFPVVPLADGASVEGVRIVVERPAGTIAGRVISEDGRPVQGAVVIVPNGRSVEGEVGRATSAITDSDGRFELSELPRGKYTVAVGERGERGAVKDIETGRRDLVVTVLATTSVHGTLVGFPAGPISVGYLGEVESRGFEARDTQGPTFILLDVPRGERWFLATNGALVALERASVRPPDETSLTLGARPMVRIYGNLVGVGRGGVGGCFWSIRIDRAMSWGIGYVSADANGAFILDAPSGLPLELRCNLGTAQGNLSVPTPETIGTGRVEVPLTAE
jgi:hypothetical protein